MIATIEEEIAEGIIAYRDDPIGFVTRVLDVRPEHIWPKMREVAESVRDHQLTAVPAGHSVSKTFGAARLVVWFKACFNPSTVITTAPSDNQIRNQLWREIRTAYSSAKIDLAGKMTTLQWDCKPQKDILASLPPEDRGLWEKNFAIGFSTTPDAVSEHATRMHGWHNDWLLIILDEAAGILPPIWRAVLEGLIINPRCKVLAIGNPTDPYSIFADVCKPGSGWNVIPISVRDTPNYIEDREVIPGVAGRGFEAQIIRDYGEGSNEHKYRCLGEFPEFAEGVIWGQELAALDRRGHIGDYPWERTALVYTFGDYGTIYTAIGFFQFIGPTIRMIDYWYDDKGVGVPEICKMWANKPYNYAKHDGHWMGADYHPIHGSNRKSLATGKSILSEFSQLGYEISTCPPHRFVEGLKQARSVWPLMRIDGKCMDFVDAIRQYKFKKNIRYSTKLKPAYSKDPEPTPSRHPADMFKDMSVIYRSMPIDGVILGDPRAPDGHIVMHREDRGATDELMRVMNDDGLGRESADYMMRV